MPQWRADRYRFVAGRNLKLVPIGIGAGLRDAAIVDQDLFMAETKRRGCLVMRKYHRLAHDHQAWRRGRQEMITDLLHHGQRQDLIGIQRENEIMTASHFAKAALGTKSRPRIGDHASAERLCDGLCVVLGARIDDDDFATQRDRRLDRCGNAIGFVERSDQDAERNARRCGLVMIHNVGLKHHSAIGGPPTSCRSRRPSTTSTSPAAHVKGLALVIGVVIAIEDSESKAERCRPPREVWPAKFGDARRREPA